MLFDNLRTSAKAVQETTVFENEEDITVLLWDYSICGPTDYCIRSGYLRFYFDGDFPSNKSSKDDNGRNIKNAEID